MKTKFILFAIVAMGVFPVNAQTKTKPTAQKPNPWSYAKQKELSVLQIDGWKNALAKLRDTTAKYSSSYNIFRKNELMSNNFKAQLVMTYGGLITASYKGNLTEYRKNPPRGVGVSKEKMQPNTKDSAWVVDIDGKKVIMNYYYVFFTDENGKTKAKSTMLACYDDGVNEMQAALEPESLLALYKAKTEAEFKAQLPKISELVQEVTKAMQVYLKNL